MFDPVIVAINVVAIVLLIGPLYFRRHHGRDLVTAYLVLNLAVFGVASVLRSAEVGLGVGLGLLGVLSIIRLRSSELSQHEIAYYFSALAIGLIAGLNVTATWITVALIVLLLIGIMVVDSPLIMAGSRSQRMRLDRAFAHEGAARQVVAAMLPGQVKSMTILNVDFVNDFTLVDVRWRQDAAMVENALAEGALAADPQGTAMFSGSTHAPANNVRVDR